MKHTLSLVIAAFAAGAAVTFARQDVQEAGAPAPEMLARMTPGAMHEKLAPLIGNWTVAGKWRMTPDAPWEEFNATMTREWIMDGRFVRELVESEFMGQPFRGMALMGYDNIREEYTSVWIENMATGTMISTGKLGADGGFTFVGENSNAMTGEKDSWGKSTIRIVSPTKHVYAGFAKDDSGKEFMNMEMVAAKR